MKCKICSQKVNEFEDFDLKKTFLHCSYCEAIFVDEQFLVTKEREKSQYDNHNNSLEDAGYVKMFEDFLDFFWEDIKESTKTALDFGSGPGPVLDTLIKRRGVSCDIYDKFYQQDKIYEHKTYDLITSTEVFEHLENPKEVLHSLKKSLHVGSHVALMSLFHTNKKEDFLKWWYRRDPTHITFFTPKTLKVLAYECGFELIKHDSKRIALLRYM
jgi:cyclopropane fatty-acyl-phospholipid synthase-like methyltransferase